MKPTTAVAVVVLALVSLPASAQSLADASAAAKKVTHEWPLSANIGDSAAETPVPPTGSDATTRFTLWQEVSTIQFPRPLETMLSETPIYRPNPIGSPSTPMNWRGPAPMHGVTWAVCQQGVTETARMFVSEWTTALYEGRPRIEASSRTSLTLAYPSGRRQVLGWKCVPTV